MIFSPRSPGQRWYLCPLCDGRDPYPRPRLPARRILFHAPGIRQKFRKLWPFLLVFDVLWSLSPFLLLHHISFGLALACTTLLVYSPFAQRSLVLMGAGGREPRPLAAAADSLLASRHRALAFLIQQLTREKSARARQF